MKTMLASNGIYGSKEAKVKEFSTLSIDGREFTFCLTKEFNHWNIREYESGLTFNPDSFYPNLKFNSTNWLLMLEQAIKNMIEAKGASELKAVIEKRIAEIKAIRG